MAESTMLRELRIRNLAVIEEITVPFASGLNVLTGETGAGKSILVDAILLVLGARAHPDLIRSGEDLATVQRLLGHERLETTAIYTQPTARDLEQAVRRLEAEPDN